MPDILGCGLSFPLSVDHRAGIAMCSGETDVEQAIRVILSTVPGERPMRPEFGCELHSFLFETIDAETVGRIDTAVRVALDRWEPRIDVAGIEVDLSRMTDGVLEINVGYRIRATSQRHNLVYPFYVIPAEEFE